MAAQRKHDDHAARTPASRPGETGGAGWLLESPPPHPEACSGAATGSPAGALQARVAAAFSPARRARTWRYGGASALTAALALVLAGWLLRAQL